MKALTVWQPWATLIAIGAKPFEFRGWAAPKAVRGQRIAIHAGARPIKRDEVQDLIVRLRSGDSWTTGLHSDQALELLDRVLTAPGVLARSAVVCTAVVGEPVRSHEIAHVFGGAVNDRAIPLWRWNPTRSDPPSNPPRRLIGPRHDRP